MLAACMIMVLGSGGLLKAQEKLNRAQDNDIKGKVICGYQGWFNAEGDGMDLGWKHYALRGTFEPGSCSIDMWPDVSELSADEKFATPFRHQDGSPAFVFSSAHPTTVERHFRWMKEYGIDGVFVQRFVSTMKSDKRYENLNHVFALCQQSSAKYKRSIGVMYDLSMSGSEVVEYVIRDWKQLVDKHNLRDTGKENVLTHEGKPLVAIWGVGFRNRNYTMADIRKLITFFKEDPDYGGCNVLLGVPTYWRTLRNDCIEDPELHAVLKLADIIHPWTVGRYKNLEGIDAHKATLVADRAWCDQNNLDYMSVVFPGFSWHNLRSGTTPLNAIPRLRGEFLWRQFYNAMSAGSEMIYVAMFDEIDEGTAIFKVTNDPPVGASRFATYEGLPSDYYLWLTGRAAAMLRNEIPRSETRPEYVRE